MNPASFVRLTSIRSLVAAAAVFAMGGCSGSSTDSAGVTRGAAKKGEACTVSTDCNEPAAICRKGNVCTGPIDATAFTTECASGSAASCAGLSCIVLKPNKQSKTGLCSLPCAADADCTAGNICTSFAGAMVCLKVCATSAECNGFACVGDPADPAHTACLAEPL